MSTSNKQLIRDFFVALGRGEDLHSFLTEDMTAWIVSSGETDKARFLQGVGFLAAIFGGTLTYEIDALTEEEDRLSAEVHSHGTLGEDEAFANQHVFLFRIREGRIAWLGEFMNQQPVNEQIVPRLMAAMEKSAG